LQVLAAEIAQARGDDVDKPRNLAESVTVEQAGSEGASAFRLPHRGYTVDHVE